MKEENDNEFPLNFIKKGLTTFVNPLEHNQHKL